jgi:hypothetical protein
VSIHGEGGRVVVQLPGGERREIEAKDLGISNKEANDDDRDANDERPDDDEPGSAGVAAFGRGPDTPTPGAAGAQEDRVPGSELDADAGAGAVAGGERGREEDRAHDGDGDPSHVVGQGEP